MEDDDELVFEIKDALRKSKNTFESTINKKRLSSEELEELFEEFNG
ncbi:hypothetical protein HQ545_04595 [Candidatus Woesearchaeota archaeon]|nr:hypothetical protein [Candidatus Woesearchaeota archaeon]